MPPPPPRRPGPARCAPPPRELPRSPCGPGAAARAFPASPRRPPPPLPAAGRSRRPLPLPLGTAPRTAAEAGRGRSARASRRRCLFVVGTNRLPPSLPPAVGRATPAGALLLPSLRPPSSRRRTPRGRACFPARMMNFSARSSLPAAAACPRLPGRRRGGKGRGKRRAGGVHPHPHASPPRTHNPASFFGAGEERGRCVDRCPAGRGGGAALPGAGVLGGPSRALLRGGWGLRPPRRPGVWGGGRAGPAPRGPL